jgi:hypothetical protein
MEENRGLDPSSVDALIVRFQRVVDVVFNKILARSKLPKLSRTTVEALFVAVLRHIDRLESLPKKDLTNLFKEIREAPQFSLASLKEGLSHTDKVVGRLDAAIAIASHICGDGC